MAGSGLYPRLIAIAVRRSCSTGWLGDFIVRGENFVPGVAAYVNGQARLTEFIHPAQVDVELAAADLSAPGSLTIELVNPAPAGGPSVNSLSFTVSGSGQNPIPSVDWLLPAGVPDWPCRPKPIQKKPKNSGKSPKRWWKPRRTP